MQKYATKPSINRPLLLKQFGTTSTMTADSAQSFRQVGFRRSCFALMGIKALAVSCIQPGFVHRFHRANAFRFLHALLPTDSTRLTNCKNS